MDWKVKMFVPLKKELKNLSGTCFYIPRGVLNNWTAEEIPVTFRTNSE